MLYSECRQAQCSGRTRRRRRRTRRAAACWGLRMASSSVADTTRSRRPPTAPRLYERTATRAFRFLVVCAVAVTMAAQCQSFFPLTTAFPLRRHLAAGGHRAGHVQGWRRRLPAHWASSSPSGESQHPPPKPAKRRRHSGGGGAAACCRRRDPGPLPTIALRCRHRHR
jgi:hypothetical protein